MEMTVKKNGMLTVTPHPLTLDGQRHIPHDLVHGETLLSFLKRHEPSIDSGAWVVAIGGYEVPAAMWDRIKPKHGTIIECRAIVRKEVVKIAAVVALAVFAPQLAPAMYTAMGGTFVAANAATMVGALQIGITVAGSLVINKVLAPKIANPGSLRDIEASPTYKLTGGNNRARPYEPLQLLFGELRVTPDYASLPYTFFEGDDQFLYSVFHAGINCGKVSSIRIGQTPIESYSDVATRAAGISGMTNQDLEGWGNVDTIDGAQLLNTGTPEYVTRTSSANTILLQADFEGSLYKVENSGALAARTINLTGEYRLLPDGAWQPFFGSGSTVTLTNATTKPMRKTYSRSVPEGQYEVRFRKDTVDVNGTQESNNLSWNQLKSVQPDTGTYGGMGRFGIKIRASGQLNGALDEVRWLATAKEMLCWNGSEWATATTRANGLSNPGAQMLLYARGVYDDNGKLLAGMGLSDSQIDFDSLKAFMVWCAANNFTFDHVFDSQISHGDVLDHIAAVGFGAHAWHAGKLGVSWAANEQPIEGVVNMATMKAKTFKINYNTVEAADGLEYAFYDRSREYVWKTLRVADPGVETALNPARITSVGVTSEAHAAILARFHLGQSIYQRKDIQYEADLEHLTYRRNSVMALTHDITQWGYGGRVQAAVDNAGFLTLTLDDGVSAGATRYIGLRIPGERGYRVFPVEAFEGASRTVTLTEEWPAGVPVPGSASNPASDTIWIYDFKSTPGYRVRVVSIQPQSGLKGATVNVVPDSDEFWDYVFNGTYSPPASASRLPVGAPVLSNLAVTEELQRQGNTYYVDLSLTFSVTGAFERAEVWGATGGSALQKIGETATRRFSWRGTINDVWSLELRPFDRIGRPGTVARLTYTVEGLRRPPPDVPAFTITNGVFLWPDETGTPDLAGSRIRFHYGRNDSWGDATPLHAGLLTSAPFKPDMMPPGAITVMIKHVDTSGNESVKTAVIYNNFGDIIVENLILEYDDQAEGFAGQVTNGAAIDGGLLADDSGDLFWGADNAPFWGALSAPFWPTATYKEMTYVLPYQVSAEEAGSRLTLDISVLASSYNVEFRYETQGLFWGRNEDYFWGDDDDLFWPPPTSWRTWPGAIESVPEGLIEFRITTQAGVVRGVVSALALKFDVPDEYEELDDIVILASGTRLPITKTYRSIKNVSLTLQSDGGSAKTVKIIDKSTDGPLVACLDGVTQVTGLIDARVQGVRA